MLPDWSAGECMLRTFAPTPMTANRGTPMQYVRSRYREDEAMHTETARRAEARPGAVQRARLEDRPAWLLKTRNTSVCLCLGPEDTLLLPYWGANGQTDDPADYLPQRTGNRTSERAFVDGQPLAYPTHGEASFMEPCLVVAREDGSRGVRLTFVEDRVSDKDGDRGSVLELVFRDELL